MGDDDTRGMSGLGKDVDVTHHSDDRRVEERDTDIYSVYCNTCKGVWDSVGGLGVIDGWGPDTE